MNYKVIILTGLLVLLNQNTPRVFAESMSVDELLATPVSSTEATPETKHPEATVTSEVTPQNSISAEPVKTETTVQSVTTTTTTGDKPVVFLDAVKPQPEETVSEDTNADNKEGGSAIAPAVKAEKPDLKAESANSSVDKSENELIAQTAKTPNLTSYYNLGKYYFEHRQYDKAEVAFAKAHEKGKQTPNDALYIDTVYYQGDIYYNTQRYADSERKYRQVLTMGLNDAELHSYLGDALRKQSKFKQAKMEYEKALQMDADNSIAKEGIDNVCKSMKCN